MTEKGSGADGHCVRGRGDQGERVAGARVVADSAGDDGRCVEKEVVHLHVHRTGNAHGCGGAMAVISLGEMLVTTAAWPPTRTVSERAKAHAVNHDGAAGCGQRDGSPCRRREPSPCRRSRAGRRREIGDADANDIVAAERTRSHVSPVAHAIEAGRGTNSGCTHGIECVPDADGGKGLRFRGSAGFIQAWVTMVKGDCRARER